MGTDIRTAILAGSLARLNRGYSLAWDCVILHRGSSLKPAHPGVMVGQKSSRSFTPPPKVCTKSFTESTCCAALLTRLPSPPSVIPRVPDSGRSQASIRPRSHIERRGRVIPNSLPIQNLINGQLFQPGESNPTPAFCGSPGKLLRAEKYPSQTPPYTTPTFRTIAVFHPRATTQQQPLCRTLTLGKTTLRPRKRTWPSRPSR